MRKIVYFKYSKFKKCLFFTQTDRRPEMNSNWKIGRMSVEFLVGRQLNLSKNQNLKVSLTDSLIFRRRAPADRLAVGQLFNKIYILRDVTRMSFNPLRNSRK